MKFISSAFGRKAESAFSVDVFRMSLISYTHFLEQFVLCIHKNRLVYGFVIKMQLKLIDLEKNSPGKKKHAYGYGSNETIAYGFK